MDLLEAIDAGTQKPDEREGRIYGFQYGVVKDVDTAAPTWGRIKARFGAQKDNETTHWIDPMWPGGIEGLPRIGDPVFIAFVDGDINRGLYVWHPSSRTQNRATDYMLLATTFAGMYNDLVAKFNNLKSAFNTFITGYNGHTHAYLPGPGASTPTAVPLNPGSSDADANAGSILAADGSQPAATASNTVCLSSRAKVQK